MANLKLALRSVAGTGALYFPSWRPVSPRDQILQKEAWQKLMSPPIQERNREEWRNCELRKIWSKRHPHASPVCWPAVRQRRKLSDIAKLCGLFSIMETSQRQISKRYLNNCDLILDIFKNHVRWNGINKSCFLLVLWRVCVDPQVV